MINFFQKNKYAIIHEIGSWVTTISSFIITDGLQVLTALYNGDYSMGTLLALKFLIIKSIIRAVLIKLAPSLFPLYRKNLGVLPALTPEQKAIDENV